MTVDDMAMPPWMTVCGMAVHARMDMSWMTVTNMTTMTSSAMSAVSLGHIRGPQSKPNHQQRDETLHDCNSSDDMTLRDNRRFAFPARQDEDGG
jgi:hypothetical protein